jgi:hypothetical protein
LPLVFLTFLAAGALIFPPAANSSLSFASPLQIPNKIQFVPSGRCPYKSTTLSPKAAFGPSWLSRAENQSAFTCAARVLSYVSYERNSKGFPWQAAE